MRNLVLLITLLLFLTFTFFSNAKFFSNVIVSSSNDTCSDVKTYSTLDEAIFAVGFEEQEIVISRPQIISSTTIPSNIRLRFVRDGSINNSRKLTINTRNIVADDHQIFSGTGDIDFAAGSVLRSAWFHNIVDAIKQTKDDELTLIISKQDNITEDCIVGDKVSLKWESAQNRIIANAGFKLSNISQIDAGDYQLFDGDGDFNFKDGVSLNLNWFFCLHSLLNWIEDEKVTVIVPGTNNIEYSDKVPSNIYLDMQTRNGMFSIHTGVNLHIYSPFNIVAKNNQHIITGPGTISFTKSGTVYPEWFGAVGDGITDDTKAVQLAMLSGPIVKVSGIYGCSSKIIVDSTSIIGNGTNVSGFKALDSAFKLNVRGKGKKYSNFTVFGEFISNYGIVLSTVGAFWENVDCVDCIYFDWILDKGQNNTFISCRGRGFGADGELGNNLPASTKTAALYIINGAAGNTFLGCNYNQRSAGYGYAHVLMDIDSSFPNYNPSISSTTGAMKNAFINCIFEYGTPLYSLSICSGSRNIFESCGFNCDQYKDYGPSINDITTNLIYLSSNTRCNLFKRPFLNPHSASFSSLIRQAGLGTVFEDILYVSLANNDYLLNYDNITNVNGISHVASGISGNYDKLFKNSSLDDTAYLLYFDDKKYIYNTELPWSNSSAVRLFNRSTHKEIIKVGENDLIGALYNDGKIIVDHTASGVIDNKYRLVELQSIAGDISIELPLPRYIGQEMILAAVDARYSITVLKPSEGTILKTGSPVNYISFSYGSSVTLVATDLNQWTVCSYDGVTWH